MIVAENKAHCATLNGFYAVDVLLCISRLGNGAVITHWADQG